MQGTVVQVSISPGGIPKRSIPEAFATPMGLEGDLHNHPQFHGGITQALLLVSSENIERLRIDGWPLFPGALGENLTTEGLDYRQIRARQRFRAGSALIEITKRRSPCHQLDQYGFGFQKSIFDAAARQGDPDSAKWGLSGFYASVVQPGIIRTNDIIVLLDQVV